MASIIENLNEVIGTKNEIKGILRDNGIDPGDVFAEYPNMLRSIVGSGSISGDTVNSYISAYLDSYNFIDQNELSANSYVTSDVLSAQSYITLVDLPTIDENIIPKESDTYTLGDSTYYYHTLYANRIQGASSVNIRTGGNNRLTVSSTAFRPMQQNYNLGSSDYPFATTYTSNLYISTATYLPVNTYWYDGTTYHWLGSLFN